jgi:hypothetical protein
VPFWLLLEIIGLPLVGGEQPAWTAAGWRGAFGALARLLRTQPIRARLWSVR